MKEYKNCAGFEFLRARDIPERSSVLAEFIHRKSGCRLYFHDREDDNKTFAIGFKTVPADDTGVFHILEHSVLCGSRKFPVKDPFTELIKGSLATFINAMTYGEKTLYPVSSKNDRAFLGLIDVYMDAVLHPNALSDPRIFMQEGHRYEIGENGELSVNGVVYNEMKAAYASADDYADYISSKLTYPNGTYSRDSGGNPDCIPTLNYEQFKEAHSRFYHPSNAAIFLDGSVDLSSVLQLLEGYLAEYEQIEIFPEIHDGDAIITEAVHSTYPIEENEDSKDKARAYLCHKTYPYSERYKLVALSLACEALGDANTAPLTKKILDTGMCENFYFSSTRSLSHNCLNIKFVGIKDGMEDKLIAKYDELIAEVVSEGIPRGSLEAALARYEFATREADYGSYPMGILYMNHVLDTVFFGCDPIDRLVYEDMFTFLHEMLDTEYYTDLLSECISSPRSVTVLYPDRDFTAKKEREHRLALDKIKENMSPSELDTVKRDSADFAKWQSEPDTDEARDSIPRLSLDDLKSSVPKDIPCCVSNYNGTEIISHPINTGGIHYVEMLFDLSDIPEDDIPYLTIFTELWREWDTERESSAEFSDLVKKHLGMLYAICHPSVNKDDTRLYMKLTFSCLDKEKENAVRLIGEHLYGKRMNSRETVIRDIRQLYTSSSEMICTRGNLSAIMRSEARYSVSGAINERLSGYTAHSLLKELTQDIEHKADSVIEKLIKIRDTYLVRERLTVSVTATDGGNELAKMLIDKVRCRGTYMGKCSVGTLPVRNEAIAIPSAVSCTSYTSSMLPSGIHHNGVYTVALNILNNELLWNEIRVKGGAYDTGISVKRDSGDISAYSYADPAPAETISALSRIPSMLREFCDSGLDILKYIIGAVGKSDRVTTPRLDGAVSTARYLSGISHEQLLKIREESLGTTETKLRTVADELEKIFSDATYTAVGPRSELEKLGGIAEILEI